MSEHTPGPWQVVYLDNESQQVWELYAVDGDLALADIYGTGTDATDATDAANARLIAAAPDLLAALEMILDLPTDKLHDAYNIASAAIAAAEKE